MSTAAVRYIPEFDGLRGFLSALVVIAHLEHSWLIWVWGGMDIFFVMSGFLIGSILLHDLGRPRFLRRYAIRRVLKIWPSYFAVVLLCLAVEGIAAKLSPGATGWTPGPGSVQYLFFVQHVELWFTTGPRDFPSTGYLPALGHTWSVAIEEQFYVLAPLLCLGLIRLGRSLWAGVVLLALAVAGGLYLRLAGPNSWVTLPARFDGFAAGLLLALLLRRGVQRAWVRPLAWLAVVAGSAGLAWLYATKGDTVIQQPSRPLFAIGVSLFSIGGAGLLALLHLHQGHRALALLRQRALVSMGRASYSTYLWHIPVIVYSGMVLKNVQGLSTTQTFWLQLALVYGISYLAYRAIEQPFFRYRAEQGSPVEEQHPAVKPA